MSSNTVSDRYPEYNKHLGGGELNHLSPEVGNNIPNILSALARANLANKRGFNQHIGSGAVKYTDPNNASKIVNNAEALNNAMRYIGNTQGR